MEAKSTLKIGYWNIRGLAEPLRKLANYLKLEYEDVLYTRANDNWDQQRKELGLELPNLPYIVDGETKITESNALAIYLCKKAGADSLLGKDLVETTMIAGAFRDYFIPASRLQYTSKSIDELKEATNAYFKGRNVAEFFSAIDERVKKNGFVFGELHYLDFFISEFLEKMVLLDQEIGTTSVAGLTNISGYIERVNQLPGVKEFLASERHIKRPWNNVQAIWK